MKILTFVVPCYNSQDYMRHCLDTVISGGEEVEVIIVNDGSKDNTEEIALEYMERYPNIVRVINQENSGHGGAVNTGIRNATGKYFNVVDSDDCVSKKNLRKVLDVHNYPISLHMRLDKRDTCRHSDLCRTRHQHLSPDIPPFYDVPRSLFPKTEGRIYSKNADCENSIPRYLWMPV